MYKIKLSNNVVKQLDKLDKSTYLRIYNKMQSLKENPRPIGSIKLTNADGYRIRTGDYRILYEINDKEVFVFIFNIMHRKEVYRKN
jgi:mRNA interferase RelE/StbE